MWLVVWLMACGSDGSDDKDTEPGTTEDTGDSGPTTTDTTDTTPTPTPTGDTGAASTTPTGDTGDTDLPDVDVLSASCSLHPDHPLIISCTAELASDGRAEVELVAATSTRAFHSEGGTSHELLAWGLKADTAYTWTIGSFTGSVTTGPLPGNMVGASIDVSGALTDAVDAVLMPLTCGSRYFVMIDTDGDVVWFQRNDVYSNQMHGYDWVSDPPSLFTVNERTYVETDLLGQELQRETNFRGELHHDTSHWGDYRYTLFRDSVGRFDVDGFHVWENGAIVGSFFLGDVFSVTSGSNDWSHSNGLNVDENGLAIMSILHFDSVIAVDGDPASPTFLELQWLADGNGQASLAPGDFNPIAGPLEGFSGQHNASLRDGEELWVFDNDGAGNGSRAVRFLLDPVAGTFAHDASWDVQQTCRIQGGAVPVDGGVLVTCATSGDIALMNEGSAIPAWTLAADCGGGFGATLPTHAIPVVIGD